MVKTYTQDEVDTLLEQAKVDAKAIRAEALEEAAKVCEETIASVITKPTPLQDIVAAIRRLK